MKKLFMILILILLAILVLLGGHRIIYSNEYKELQYLKTQVYKDKVDIADLETRVSKAKVEYDDVKNGNPLISQFGSNNEKKEYEELVSKLNLTKEQYKKDTSKIQLLEDKVDLFKFLK